MVERPVLLGMNNPQSSDPDAAFFPHPPGCAGHRLLGMLQIVRPEISQYDFLRAFDRRNLLDMREWVREFAELLAPGVWRALAGRQVVVFGEEVRSCLQLPRSEPLEWMEQQDVRYCLAPHPSGRNLWYNDRLHRVALALRLESLYDQAVLG